MGSSRFIRVGLIRRGSSEFKKERERERGRDESDF